MSNLFRLGASSDGFRVPCTTIRLVLSYLSRQVFNLLGAESRLAKTGLFVSRGLRGLIFKLDNNTSEILGGGGTPRGGTGHAKGTEMGAVGRAAAAAP